MRAAIRTLVALTLLAWGQFALAVDYAWQIGTAGKYPSPQASCDGWIAAAPTIRQGGSASFVSVQEYRCSYQQKSGGVWGNYTQPIYRSGTTCPSGTNYNAATGLCDTPPVPKDCSATAGKEIYASIDCTYNTSLKNFSCPSEVSYSDGCSYVSSPTGASRCDVATKICVNRFGGTGTEASEGAVECTESTCAPVPENNPPLPGEGCVTNGTNTVCVKDASSDCSVVNGKEVCVGDGQKCGTFNGTYQCFDAEKPNRNCGYFNGQQTCFDPKDPTKVIADTSSDHPINGGNADGDDTNDPRPSGGTGTSDQGSGSGATNQSIEDLGEKLGPKIDKTNSLLTDIKGKFDELSDGLLGDEYNESGTGTDADAEGAGQAAGDDLAGQIEEQAGDILEQRDTDVQDGLDALPDTVVDWFGDQGQKVGLGNVLDRVLPSATGCADYNIEYSMANPINNRVYNVRLELPVCELTRIKPLLEYVIWAITIIGLWKILYAALRQEDAKAAKGGF